MVTAAEHISDLILTGHPYLVLTGNLWNAYCRHLGGNWPWYNDIALDMILSREDRAVRIMLHNTHIALKLLNNARETTAGRRPIVFFLAATKAALWMVFSVRLSVCLSITPFWLCSHHRIITKFSGVITNDRSDVHAKGQGQRSKVKVTEVTTQLNRFRTVTPVWIHIWWWNHAYGLMILSRGALLFFKVIHQISRSHGSKKRRIWPRLGVSGL